MAAISNLHLKHATQENSFTKIIHQRILK
jgi:hypothetical protein